MSDSQRLRLMGVLILLSAAMLALGGGGFSVPGLTPKVTAVTYVREAKAIVPSGVSAALNELNAKGIMATQISEDVADGDNQVPDQYKVTLPAAKTAGIPALVVQSGDTVIRTVKAPTTKQQVSEAAQ